MMVLMATLMNSMTIVVLPIGEFDTDLVKIEFNGMISALTQSDTNISIADAETTEEGARQSVLALSEKNPDIIVIIPLRGLSAQIIETAGIQSRVPILIWPIQGRFALPSSALAIGALREARVPVELIYIPPDHPDTAQRLFPILRAAKAFYSVKKEPDRCCWFPFSEPCLLSI